MRLEGCMCKKLHYRTQILNLTSFITFFVTFPMISEIEHPLFAHEIADPPSLQGHINIDLTLTNSKGCVRLVKVGEGLQTKYFLTVTDPSSLGVSSFGQHSVELFIGDVIDACNFALRETTLSTIEYAQSQADIKYQRP
jgi:hypothetical protein